MPRRAGASRHDRGALRGLRPGPYHPGVDLRSIARDIAARHPGLRLLVLFGSRARGEARTDSDWDFAFAGAPEVDLERLHEDLTAACGTEAIDLVDLAQGTGLLRYRVARDGRPLFDAGGCWDTFWWDAVSFWCDAEPVLERAYSGVLDGGSR